jgi:hypothetical protein
MSTRTIVAVTAGTLVALGAGTYLPLTPTNSGYAIYFDYKRRTDPEFRKQLRNFSRESPPSLTLFLGRGRRQAEKQREQEKKSQLEASKKDYRQAWQELKNQQYPTRPDEMEQFFLSQISQAETLVGQGNITPPLSTHNDSYGS